MKPRIDTPVAPAIVDELLRKFVDFRRAYEPDGLTPAEFDSFGPTVRTLRQFSDACHDLERFVRDIVLSNPDLALSPSRDLSKHGDFAADAQQNQSAIRQVFRKAPG